ncbi:acyltransferase family protein [Phycicoccus flavus]|uniref:acyltransferase family protein n=1 Tax=Phycicoccus flavus TaxID=2502783 RepID=UPI000FEB619E|nr:acyltransferase family protein [Phycicoccus flavus]NHA70187.1 acyltransferase [Phycicoccus flavus]
MSAATPGGTTERSSATPAAPTGDTGDAGARPAPRFRPDIEGMRAIAIGLVVVYHAGVSGLPGGFVGVDVFFVISGFLITGLLVREVTSTGRVSLARFYARRAKRLLPATGLVLVTTVVLTWLTVSAVRWRDFGLDIVSAATYVVNWRLAARSVDYLAEDVGASPVQHFWSLAVEEQFYIVWPLLLVLLAWLLRRRPGLRPRRVMAVGIALVIVPSFAYSVYLTSVSPATAFFVTPTRLWELGIGAFVAIGATVWTRVPRVAAVVLGWVGLVTVLASGFLLTTDVAWPGYAALAPCLGTAAMIVAGYTSGPAGPAGVLAWKPLVWVGGISYSLYLWHWPLITAATAYWGDLGGTRGLLVMAVAVIPSWLSLRLIENPIRFAPALSRSNRLALSVGGNFTALGVVAGLVLVLLVPGGSRSQAAVGAAPLGAEALTGTTGKPGSVASLKSIASYVPSALEAEGDVPPYPPECQVDQESPDPVVCDWGDPNGTLTVAVVGDSKIMQYYSPLDEIAKREHWKIVSMTKSACGFHDGVQEAKGEPYTSCTEWNRAVLADLLRSRPDVVVTAERINEALADPADLGSLSTATMVDAMARQWTRVTDAGIPMVVIADNPSPGQIAPVYECIADHGGDLSACTFDRARGERESGAAAQLPAAERVQGVRVVDIRDSICPERTCVPVIGGVMVYRQTSHITDTYARSLTDVLAAALVPEVEAATGG